MIEDCEEVRIERKVRKTEGQGKDSGKEGSRRVKGREGSKREGERKRKTGTMREERKG